MLRGKRMHILWSNPFFCLGCCCGLRRLYRAARPAAIPALYLSSFNSAKVLKGPFKAGRMASLPRKILVVLQFTVSVSLIIGTLVVFEQIQYARDRPVGYTRDGLITMGINTRDVVLHYSAIRDELMRSGAVTDMAISSSPTTGIYSSNRAVLTGPARTPTSCRRSASVA